MKKWQIGLVASITLVGLFLVDGGAVYIKQMTNRPPKAAFTYRTPTRTLKYIAPTDRDLITFQNNSSDSDGDPLTYEWRINGQLVGSSRDHSTKLGPGKHKVELTVSDGRSNQAVTQYVDVDRDQVYPVKEIGIPYKGINYFIGARFGRPTADNPPDAQEMNESLDVIWSDLGCNAIKIVGDYEDVLLTCAEMAIKKGFERIVLSPRYEHIAPNIDIDINEHVARVVAFSKKAEALRMKSSGIVLCIGEELEVAVRGITNGTTYNERREELPDDRAFLDSVVEPKLCSYLMRMIQGVREHFHGPLTYSSMGWPPFQKWSELGLDIVGPMMYYRSEEGGQYYALERLLQYKKHGKAVYITEFGCESWQGASKWGSSASKYYTGQTYSQEEQANSILETMEIYDVATVDGAFLYQFFERQKADHYSWGIIKYNTEGAATRKLGFYSYKSLVTNESRRQPYTCSLKDGQSLIEAENVYVRSAFSTPPIADSQASGGMYLQPNSFLRFVILIDREGDYAMSGRVRGPTPENDSFWVKFGDDLILWDIPGFWQWLGIRNRGEEHDKVLHLLPGRYVVEVLARELGAEIDALLIRKVGST